MRKIDLILSESVDENAYKDIQKFLEIEGDVYRAKNIDEAVELAEKSQRDVFLALEEDITNYDLKFFLDQTRDNSARAMIYEKNLGQKLYWPGEGEKILGNDYLDGFKLVDIYYFSSQKRPFSTHLNNLIPIPKHHESYLQAKKIPTLFLDRDGIINHDTAYLHKVEDLVLYEEINAIIKKANQKKINVIVLTNQAGVARGMFDEQAVNILNQEINKRLTKKGVEINKIYNCFYLESGKVETYKKKSLLRKPMPGMLLKACYDFPVEISRSYMIGDKISDKLLIPGIKTLLVQRNYEIPEGERVLNNLEEVHSILEEELF